MNAVIYARYSSASQNEQSIDGQLRYCKQYAEHHGYNIVGEYIDRAMSGTNDNRPEFQQMISDSSKKVFDIVIVWKLDRFARNRYDSAIYKNKLKKNNIKVVSATEGIGEGDESIILEAVLEAMAETYSKQLSQNVRRGLKESALKANSTGGTTPLGYKIVDGKLVLEEERAKIVKYIFESYAEGVSKKQIADELNKKGIKTNKGSNFSSNSFTAILTNRKYLGVYHYNGIEIENGCPKIIDKETFDKCAERAKLNKRFSAKNKAEIEYLLTGKIFCGYCGSPMIGDSCKNRAKEKYYYYACRNKKGSRHKKPTCHKKRENKGFLEWYLVEQTVKYVLTPSRIKYIAEKVVEEYEKEFSQSGVKQLERKIHNMEKEFDDLANSLINAKSQRLINSINKKAELLEIQIEDAENELAKLRICCDAKLTTNEVIPWLKDFCNGDPLDLEFRKRIIDVLINAIYLYDDKLVIYFNVKDGEQISYIDMVEECSINNADVPPKNLIIEHIFYLFSKNGVFGAIIMR